MVSDWTVEDKIVGGSEKDLVNRGETQASALHRALQSRASPVHVAVPSRSNILLCSRARFLLVWLCSNEQKEEELLARHQTIEEKHHSSCHHRHPKQNVRS